MSVCMRTVPDRPLTTRTSTGGPSRTGMKSINETMPSAVVKMVSSTNVSPR